MKEGSPEGRKGGVYIIEYIEMEKDLDHTPPLPTHTPILLSPFPISPPSNLSSHTL